MVAKRIDANQNEIVKVLRSLGVSVLILSNVGKGCPDLLIGYRNKCYLFEIKDGKKPKSAQKLTEHEFNFFQTWKGHATIISSVDEAIEFVKNIPF